MLDKYPKEPTREEKERSIAQEMKENIEARFQELHGFGLSDDEDDH